MLLKEMLETVDPNISGMLMYINQLVKNQSLCKYVVYQKTLFSTILSTSQKHCTLSVTLHHHKEIIMLKITWQTLWCQRSILSIQAYVLVDTTFKTSHYAVWCDAV